MVEQRISSSPTVVEQRLSHVHSVAEQKITTTRDVEVHESPRERVMVEQRFPSAPTVVEQRFARGHSAEEKVLTTLKHMVGQESPRKIMGWSTRGSHLHPLWLNRDCHMDIQLLSRSSPLRETWRYTSLHVSV